MNKLFFPTILTSLVVSTALYGAGGPRIPDGLGKALEGALAKGDLPQSQELWGQIMAGFGDQAGTPEEPDTFLNPPATGTPISAAERPAAFHPYRRLLERHTWWKIGMDPTREEHALREVADAIRGQLAAARAGCEGKEGLVSRAKEAGEFLIWAQRQGGRGLLPFPAVRGGKSKAFQVAERFQQKALASGQVVTAGGWLVDDLGRGDLQFDNGLCGAALLELYEMTRDDRFKQAALLACEWAMKQPAVPNANYNTFTTFLLCQAFRVTGEKRYLENAIARLHLAVLPGQIKSGPMTGRWADGHNAKPVYHYIIVRGLVTAVAALPGGDEGRREMLDALRSALSARNMDFSRRGICNKSSAFEALLLLKMSPGIRPEEIAGCFVEEAFGALERLVVAEVREGKAPVGPLEWGLYLEYLSQKK